MHLHIIPLAHGALYSALINGVNNDNGVPMIMVFVAVIAAIVLVRFATILITLIGLLVILAGSFLALAVTSIGWIGVHLWQWHLYRKRDKIIREIGVAAVEHELGGSTTIDLPRGSYRWCRSGDVGHDDVSSR
jgi:fatty acid desaturase